MPCRARDASWNVFPKTTFSTSSNTSLFGDCRSPPMTIEDLENILGEQPNIFENPIGEEEPMSPTKGMVGNRQPKLFPIRETNGKVIMKNISPTALPYFHSLDYKYPDTSMFEFYVVCRTYYYTSDE